MNSLRVFQIDAFAEKVFEGNPAAVIILEDWLEDDILQKIAMENNLSETAYAVKKEDKWEIRWFTPLSEVALCGHATLATAFVLISELKLAENRIVFKSRQSGLLHVSFDGEWYSLNFPVDPLEKMEIDPKLEKIFGVSIQEQFKGKTDILIILENEKEVKNLSPDFAELKKIDQRGFIVSASGDSVDFVSRFFCPILGIDEDPVTGSAHTSLIPYWHKKSGKSEFIARQLSQRGGYLKCKFIIDRVEISGKAVKYMEGTIEY